MPKASPIQTSFNSGEFSSSMEGRVDFDKIQRALYRCENFIPLVQGPAERRPGTHFVATTKTEANRAWLHVFKFNRTQSYAIEFGDYTLRWFTQRGVLMLGTAPYEGVSPYSAAQLTAADGTFALQTCQSNDAMFFAHPTVYPWVLERFGATDWRFRQFGLPPGGTYKAAQYAFQWPYRSFNADNGKKLYASATTGSITLNAGLGAIFEPWMVGYLILIEDSYGGPTSIVAWEPGKVLGGAGLQQRVESRVYRNTVAGTTGTVRMTHTEGIRADGAAVTWEYVHAGYGVALIKGYVAPNQVTADVIMELPSNVVGAPNMTPRFQLQAWNTVDGMPTCCAFFRGRLWWARGTTVWGSVAGDFYNYAEREAGEVLPDSAITLTIAQDTADQILWMRPSDDGLLIGTNAGVLVLREVTSNEPLGPANVDVFPQNAVGVSAVAPVKAQSALLYIDAAGTALQEAAFNLEENKIRSRDLSVLADHACASGIVQMDFQVSPRKTLFLARRDGMLVTFTYNKEQDVYGWHRHRIGGTDAAVESVAVIPSPDGGMDDVWLIVRRTISGIMRRYVEYLDRGFRDGDAIASAWYVDSGLAYEGAAVTGVNGLLHLVGETVAVQAMGAAHPPRVVNFGGGVAFDYPVTRAVIGLPAPCKLATMRRNEGAADGTAQGKMKRIHQVAIRLKNTVGGKLGPDENHLDSLEFRDSSVPMGQAVPPFTGDKIMTDFPSTYESEGRVWYVNDQPLPATVVAIMPKLLTMD
jgi:hypothetical protein